MKHINNTDWASLIKYVILDSFWLCFSHILEENHTE